MAYDGIVTKAIASEIKQLTGARIDKVYEPNKNTVILGFYFNGNNYALNICVDSKYTRLNLSTHSKSNPKSAPNFCMLLRKHLIGLRLNNIYTYDLERVIFIDFEGFDDIDELISKKLVIELMGKHSNIILLDDENNIIDSLRHTKNADDGYRNIVPHSKYSLPTTDKSSFLELSNFNDFKNKLQQSNNDIKLNDISLSISSTFNGICKSFIDSIINELDIKKEDDINVSLEKIYLYICNVINNIGTKNLEFKLTQNEKDYYLSNTPSKNDTKFSLNFFIDDFYFSRETSNEFKVYRDSILKLIFSSLKKYNKRLININNKLNECKDMDIYKLYGELITANLYKFRDKKNRISEMELENYYDSNKIIKIPIDAKYSIADNAKRYFKKYNKLKNALDIVSIQKNDTIRDLNYIESVVYEIENSSDLTNLSNIFEEILENDIFSEYTKKYKNNKKSKLKKSNLTKNKTVNFNPIKFTIDGYTILVGRNNKENDYLSLKYANKSDIWFHTKDIHGSHVILKNDIANKNIAPSLDNIDINILTKCAEIAAFHSKAKNSSNVPVDYCFVKHVSKPSGSKPGMVIYKQNKTLVVNPKKYT